MIITGIRYYSDYNELKENIKNLIENEFEVNVNLKWAGGNKWDKFYTRNKFLFIINITYTD